MSVEQRTVGVIGAGMMGSGMAANLLASGHRVLLAPRRTSEAVDRLVEAGAETVASPAALAEASDVVLTCVSDSVAVAAVAEQILPALGPEKLWIDATTADPGATREIAARVAARGAVFADAPVTGGPAQAKEGELASLVGCSESDFPEVRQVVGSYSKVVRRFGEVGTGHLAKLLNNLVTQGTTALLAEAYGAAREQGVDWQALYDVMMTGAARSGTLEKAVGPALRGDFDGSAFTIRNSEKDLRYAVRALGEVSPSVARAAHAVLLRRVEQGHGDAFISRMLDLPLLKP
ncbi:NAD(P)-dependent oxidoreductase [Halovulum sp. GXIMD14794]